MKNDNNMNNMKYEAIVFTLPCYNYYMDTINEIVFK